MEKGKRSDQKLRRQREKEVNVPGRKEGIRQCFFLTDFNNERVSVRSTYVKTGKTLWERFR